MPSGSYRAAVAVGIDDLLDHRGEMGKGRGFQAGNLALVIQTANHEDDIDVGVLREGLDILCAHGPALQL